MSNVLLSSVCRAMERIAPLRLAFDWDNVGLLLESPVSKNRNIERVLLTIDITPTVLEEAISSGASVIVSYHTPIFAGLKRLTLSNPLQSTLLRCAAEGISIYCAHTTLDCVYDGVNDWLAKGLVGEGEKPEVKALIQEKFAPDGKPEGAEGRLVKLPVPTTMDILESRIKKHLGCSQIQVGYALPPIKKTSPISTVAICAGGGGSMVVGTDADVYFTGEMQHHEVIQAVSSGKHVVLCGHTNTERGYLPTLAAKLEKELKGENLSSPFEILISKNDEHPLQIL